MMSLSKNDILGVVLAGGQGRRMGGVDKPLVKIGKHTILEHILKRSAPQFDRIIINANNAENYQAFGLETVPDAIDGYLGPLSGILTAMDWAAINTQCSHILTIPGDAPFIPQNLASEMIKAANLHESTLHESTPLLVRAVSNNRPHPVIGLWPAQIRPALRDRLVNDEVRKIDLFTQDYTLIDVDFQGIPDPFFNINTQEDADTAERALKQTPQ